MITYSCSTIANSGAIHPNEPVAVLAVTPRVSVPHRFGCVIGFRIPVISIKRNAGYRAFSKRNAGYRAFSAAVTPGRRQARQRRNVAMGGDTVGLPVTRI
jgi:hypothetical protein